VPDRRSSCPVACALDIFGDKWTLLVIRDLFLGKQRFDEFIASPEGIATNILADRLTRLRDHGLVEQRADPAHRGRGSYHLTPRGASLEKVMRAMVAWGLENIPRTRVFKEARGR
jgi:DNA-binding HxlR family transcriptional regulator